MTLDLTGRVPSPVPGVGLDTVLVLSTRHMPDPSEDLSTWDWGSLPDLGLQWFYAYEEDSGIDGKAMPEWLLNLCITARDKYNANWILLDPNGGVLDEFPVYEH